MVIPRTFTPTMKKIRKLLIRALIGVLVLTTVFAIAVVVFVNVAPQFGQPPFGADLKRMQESPNYKKDGFVNLIPTSLGPFSEMMKTLPELLRSGGEPTEDLPTRFDFNTTHPVDSLCFVTWYGHSSFLIEMDGQRILIDPMLSEYPSPIAFGTKRFGLDMPIPIASLTNIDVMILSHDHYDHLDYETVLTLADEVGHFYTALGVGSHLKHWGILADRITELDWWESATAGPLELVACPSRHFSGRGLTDRWKTQWASWVIKGQYQNLYFSGDGGYGPHFKEIGERHGPFDLAMMECGQYFRVWKHIHLMPEESVLAGTEVKGKLLMPIHWGSFKLAPHHWKDPIERFKLECERRSVPWVHPYVGERFCLGRDFPQTEWWHNVN